MFKVKSDNPNYLAKLVKLGPALKVPNSDRLQYFLIDGNAAITDLKAQEGQHYIFFPVESSINSSFLAYTNSYSEASLNTDKTKKGFFGNSGRVKAVRLRGAKSEGYIIPVEVLMDWLWKDQKIKGDFVGLEVDTYFDSYGDILICEKYVNREALRKLQNAAAQEKNRNKKVKRESRLVELQFRIAEDTKHLKREIQHINPDDYITISYKMHGCNGSFGKVLCKKTLNKYQKFFKWLGADINDTFYDLVYASRRVVKNEYNDDKGQQSYYKENVWQTIADRYKDSIKPGVTLYGEVVNQLSSGAFLQKNYDYGLPEKTSDLFVYRITYTSSVGQVFEFSTPQIQRYCAKAGLKTVPIFYYGKAKDLFPMLSTADHWHDELLKKLLEKYTEKKCFMCKNDVWEEGIVLTKEDDFFTAFKLKSFNFLAAESAELDAGGIDMDTAESITNEQTEIQQDIS